MSEVVVSEQYAGSGLQKSYAIPEGQRKLICVRIPESHPVSGAVLFLKKVFLQVFLPEGYPSSVSSDYYEYQIWDTIQAFCSTISGTLTTNAIMKGVGVGDASATALAATFTWILKDGTGMIGRILFAWWKGSMLDTDCKKWRLAADIINDCAMCLELLIGTSTFRSNSLPILCLSMCMKSIVGVAGGATRAAITQHQAIRDNMADVSAKDGSQETCVNLIASFLGLFILSRIESNIWAIWLTFILVTILHLYANYRAVKSLKMKTLNIPRFNLLCKWFLEYSIIKSPEDINEEESVFLGYDVTDETIHSRSIFLGSSLESVTDDFDGSSEFVVDRFLNIPKDQRYIIFVNNNYKSIKVILHVDATPVDVMEAYFKAVVMGVSNSISLFMGVSDSPIEDMRSQLQRYKEMNSKEITEFEKTIHIHWDRFIYGLGNLALDPIFNNMKLLNSLVLFPCTAPQHQVLPVPCV